MRVSRPVSGESQKFLPRFYDLLQRSSRAGEGQGAHLSVILLKFLHLKKLNIHVQFGTPEPQQCLMSLMVTNIGLVLQKIKALDEALEINFNAHNIALLILNCF